MFRSRNTNSHRRVASVASSSPRQAWPKKKKTWGGKKGTCEKWDLRGQRKAPPPRQKGSGRHASEGPCDPLVDKCRQNPRKGGTPSKVPPQDRAVPWESLLRGVGKTTRRVSETTPCPSRKGVAAQQNTRGKRKQGKRSTGKPLPPRAPRKEGLRTSTRRIPKTRRAQNGTPENAKKRDAQRKRANTNAAGHKKRKRTSKTSACEGVSCYYLICIFPKKGDKRRRRKNQRKRERNQKTPDLTSREFFRTLSGANRQEIKQKHRQKPTKKHKTNNTTQKQKFAPRKIFQKTTPRREERQKTTRDTEPDTKKTK